MKTIVQRKSNRLFVILGAFFVCNALVAEFIGVKVFSLEPTLGWKPFHWNLFGIEGTLMYTAGNLLWPVVFIMTDILNEYFGKRGVRFLSFLAVILIGYAFLIVFTAIRLSPADFWMVSGADRGVPDMQAAYSVVFGQSLWIIIGSIIAFLVGQLLDVIIFQRIRRITGESRIYLRATVSTMASQLIDSFIVLYIAFVIGPQQWSVAQWMAIGTQNYIYKVLAAIALIPGLYLAHYLIDSYLGEKEAARLKREAALSS
jgi:uncharacterized integral membrane protein (TIGR00697 family)